MRNTMDIHRHRSYTLHIKLALQNLPRIYQVLWIQAHKHFLTSSKDFQRYHVFEVDKAGTSLVAHHQNFINLHWDASGCFRSNSKFMNRVISCKEVKDLEPVLAIEIQATGLPLQCFLAREFGELRSPAANVWPWVFLLKNCASWLHPCMAICRICKESLNGLMANGITLAEKR